MDNRSFFDRDTCTVAEQMIGSYLIRNFEQSQIIVQITETEAYKGSGDPASHAYSGMTRRNKAMFGLPGTLYVYLSYGIHACVNVVTENQGIPGAVLLRGAVPIAGQEAIEKLRAGKPREIWLNGPGKLAQGLAVSLDFNGRDLFGEESIALCWKPREHAPKIKKTPRIGISRGTDLLWRFVIDS